MNDLAAPVRLNEAQRLADTFVAPSRTFLDIRRSAAWWGPLLVMFVVGLIFNTAVDRKVGWNAVAHSQIERMPAVADRLNQLPADQQAAQYNAIATRTKYQSYGSVVIILIFASITALLWWMSLNFILGASTKYSEVLAVFFYAGMPKLFIWLIAAALLWGGVGADGLDLQNPAGTNLGYYLPQSMPVLRTVGSFLDIFGLWALFLAVMGTAIISGKKMSQTALVVVGWWLIGMALTAGLTAAFS